MFREDRVGSVLTCSFLTVCVFNTFVFQYFCVSSSFGNSRSHGGRRSISEQLDAGPAAQQFVGLGLGTNTSHARSSS